MKTGDLYSNGTVGLTAFLVAPRFRLLRHILFITICLAYMVYGAVFYRPFISDNKVLIAVWLFLFVFNIGPAYVNACYLMPGYLFEHRYTTYVLYLSGLIVLMVLSLEAAVYYLDRFHQSGQFLTTVLSLKVFIPLSLACPMAVIFFCRWHIYRWHISQLENSTVLSELEQLKKQINPHFLFNMLNNANVLVKTDIVQASVILEKLKDLLQYQLIDGAENEVLLMDDVQFLTDFLNLEKIRRDHFEFTVTTEGPLEEITIPPLLFILFVENAVKHNPDNDSLSYVYLIFRVNDHVLNFRCVNSKPAETGRNAGPGGLGLKNVRRRLELLYGDRFSLDIKDEYGIFQVDLAIKLI
ncbi:MAG: histidine kinase [Bacteroidales bacterium]|jgi:hypothetical protein|nr:histidine kinase [Bacteroidales bacterium]